MTDLEAITLKEIELIKAKATIAVAIINTLKSAASSYSEESIEGLVSTIEKVQATLD